ncbi:netrin-G1-like [Boleophthalmus pectinirostris]|uniref:netrin-G1-like n=1 Tax=Boleophthalmus pectinirostris TaxID=150288 RepID=UPI0024311B66|nr:netrin-G1-like [Boleophthalmus pectinirostris]
MTKETRKEETKKETKVETKEEEERKEEKEKEEKKEEKYERKVTQKILIPGSSSALSKLAYVSFTACECNDHSNRCSFIDFLEVVTCVSCKHNTRGRQCHLCRPGFYRNASVPLSNALACTECLCDPLGALSSVCAESGACPCKGGATGRRCDLCERGYNRRESGCTENVCDEDLLQCQNGGTCVDFTSCSCPSNYTGSFCEQELCLETEGCSQDATDSAPRPFMATPLYLMPLLLLKSHAPV